VTELLLTGLYAASQYLLIVKNLKEYFNQNYKRILPIVSTVIGQISFVLIHVCSYCTEHASNFLWIF